MDAYSRLRRSWAPLSSGAVGRRLARPLQCSYNILVSSDLRFEWDPRKASANAKKHGVTFEEASTVFSDENGLFMADPEHSESEDRFLLLGISRALKLLVVCHCFRTSVDVVRIINARKADRSERRQYNERLKR